MTCISYLNNGFKVGATIGLVGFNVKVTITSGRAVVATYGTVPDGEFEIAATDGHSQSILSLTRRDAEDRTVQVVTSVNYGKGP